MFPSDEEIDRDVYLPQDHWFLWDGQDRFPYLLSERALAEADVKKMLNRTSLVELWLCESGVDRKIRSWAWT